MGHIALLMTQTRAAGETSPSYRARVSTAVRPGSLRGAWVMPATCAPCVMRQQGCRGARTEERCKFLLWISRIALLRLLAWVQNPRFLELLLTNGVLLQVCWYGGWYLRAARQCGRAKTFPEYDDALGDGHPSVACMSSGWRLASRYRKPVRGQTPACDTDDMAGCTAGHPSTGNQETYYHPTAVLLSRELRLHSSDSFSFSLCLCFTRCLPAFLDSTCFLCICY